VRRSISFLAPLFVCTLAHAATAVVTRAGSTELERFAAAELCNYLGRLFGIDVKPSAQAPRNADAVFLVGQATGLSGQGLLLKTIRHKNRAEIRVSGGSAAATLWAVYELAERWGVRYLLHGDLIPPKARFQVPELDEVKQPVFPVRQWRVMNEHAVSQISWGIADYRPFIDQLAKLRFNRLLLQIWQTQPFLSYEAGGIHASSGTLFFGNHFPITAGMAGRSLFGDEREFWNPDLQPNGPFEAVHADARKHLTALIDYARSRGMECVISATPTEYPPEFAPLLKDPKFYKYQRVQVAMPGAATPLDDPNLTALASALLRATVNTYPDVRYMSLDVTEFREWVGQYERAWKGLNSRYGVAKVRSLDALLESARRRPDYPGGQDRAAQEVKGDLVNLRFFDRLLNELGVLKDSRRPDIRFIFSNLAEELFPILPLVLPKGSETLNFIDYTPSRVLRRRAALARIPAREIPSVLIYTLHDDNVGLLPQLATGSLHELTKDLRSLGWAGFSTRLWLLGDQDPCAAYLSKAGWDPNATPDAVYRDQLRAACGEGCVNDMLEAYRELESVTRGLEWHGLGLTFFTPDMMMKHWRAGAMAPELIEDRRGYQRARDSVLRARDRASTRNPGYLDYWVARLQFGILYLEAVEQVRRAATADAAGQRTEAISHTEAALESVRRAIEAYAGVVKDRSDRAAIATLNEFAYRPLLEKKAALEKEHQP
jgi:hypothetical protein